MSIRKLLRFTTKTSIAGGSVYYYYELGLWKNTDETLKNYESFKQDVKGFLDSSPALVDYVNSATDSVKEKVNPVTQKVTNFREKWIDIDLSSLRGEDGIIKTGWNKSVGLVVDVIAASPDTIKDLSITGWTKVKELTNNPNESSSTSPSPTGQQQQSS